MTGRVKMTGQVRVKASGSRRFGCAATTAVCVLCLLGLSVAARAQSISFAGVQTTLPLVVAGQSLNGPQGVAVDASGDVFIADTGNQRVVEIFANGTQTALSVLVNGSGLNGPEGVAVDSSGDIFIADTGNNRVVEIPVSGPQVVVGSGLSLPACVAVDGFGNVFIADTNNNRVVQLPAGGGAQSTVGTGLSQPSGVTVDATGDVFIADTGNQRVVEVPVGGTQAIILGNLGNPTGVAVDGAGDVFISISVGLTSSTLVEVTAGGSQTEVGSGLSFPFQLAVDLTGDVFIADDNNNRVVEVQPGPANFGSVNVCPGGQTSPAPCSGTLTLNFNVSASLTLGSNAVSVVTQGAPNLDFTLSSTTCAGSQTAGIPCVVVGAFTPLVPGLRMGAVQITDSLNNLLVETLVQGVGQGPLITFGAYTGNPIPSPTDGFSNPTGLAMDASGDVFVADTNNNRVVEAPFVNGAYGTPAIIPTGNYTLGHPAGVTVDGAGNLFITNPDNMQVVEVPYINGAYNGSLASTMNAGGTLVQPFGIAVDGAGNLFIADGQLSQVVEVPAGGGAPILLGNGLSQPYAVALDAADNVYIADSGNSRLVEVLNPSGTQVLLDGTSGNPYGVAIDAAGDAFYTDLDNNGIVELPLGGTPFTLPNIGLQFPTGVALDAMGDYFIANSGNNQVFEVTRSQLPGGFGFANTPVGQISSDSPQSVLVENAGTGTLTGSITGLGASTGFLQSNVGMAGACNNISLSPGAICTLAIEFLPPAVGGFSTNVVFTDNSLNGSPLAVQSFGLQGTGILEPQFITFTTNAPASAPSGTSFAVAANASSGLPVTFNASGSCSNSGPTGATFTMTGSTGTCTVTASQPGNSYYSAAASIEITAATGSAPAVVETSLSGTSSSPINVCPAGQSTPAPCTNTFTLNYSIAANVTLGSTAATAVSVLTQGAPNLDFTLASTSCTGSQSAGSTCAVTVTFAPRAPGLRMGAVEIIDSSGNVLATTPVQGVGQGPAIAFASSAQITLPAPVNGYSNPQAITVDGAGDIFVADSGNNQVVEVLAGGLGQTTVGSGLNQPTGVAVDGAGNVFIADSGNNRVVKVPYLGNGSYGAQTMVSSTLNQPFGVAVDGAGNLFITDSGNNQVLEVEAGCCVQATVASGLNGPYSLAVDAAGDLFIADTVNQQVLEFPYVSPGAYGAPITVANSNNDGLSNVYGVAVDAAGDVFITDTFNYRVVEVTYQGNGKWGNLTNVGSGLRYSSGVAVDATGDVFIADSGNNRVAEEQRSLPPTLSFANTYVGNTSSDSPQSVTEQNVGNASLNSVPPGLSVGQNFEQVPGSGTPADCASTFSMAPGGSCNLSVSFTPLTSGLLVSQATFTDNALNATAATQSITLEGTGVGLNQPTTVSISPSTASVAAGGTQQFTATVTGTTNTAVTWSIEEGPTGGTISGSGLYTAPAAAGTFHVVATSVASPSVSAVAVVSVSTGPSITVSISPSTASVAAGGTQQFTATVTGTTNTAVTWSVEEGPDGGTISASGLYTAPAAAGTFHVVATSDASPVAIGVAVVTAGGISESITVNDAVTITTLINVASPVASFSTSSLGFGNVAAGETGTQIITVSNAGEGSTGLVLSGAVIPPSGPFTLGAIACSNGANSFPTTLPSGGACLVTISYTAPASGTPTSTITFTDNAGLSNLATMPVGGSNYTQTVSLNGAGTTSPPPLEPPLISSIAPSVGLPGQQGLQVTIAGANFVAGATTATVGGGTAGITVGSLVVNSTSSATALLNIDSSTAPGSYDVVLTVNGAANPAILPGGFTVAVLINEIITVNDQVSIILGQTITFGTAPVVVVFGSGQLNATASSGLPVTFSSTTPAICSVNGSTVTSLAAGSCIVAANQAGNGIYGPAPQVTQTILILDLSPLTLNFGNQLVGTTSATQKVTLVNTGALALTVGTIATTGNFIHPAKTCAAKLPPGESCTISVAFAPKSTGTLNGTLTVGANGTVALSGTGIAPSASITPSTYTFASQQVGTASSVQTFTYTNTGLVSITISSVSLSGKGAADFAIATDTCIGATLVASTTCSIGVTFTPEAAQEEIASLTVTDTKGGAPSQSASLSGTGIAPIISLGSGTYAYGSVKVATAATFTLTNSGTAPFAISTVALSAGIHFQVTGGSCLVGGVVSNGSSCTVIVTFTPVGNQEFADALTVSGTGVGSGAPTYTATRKMTGR